MKRLSGLLLVIVFVLGLSSISMAQTGGINRRERQQRLRIRQGIRSDELTRREAARLTAEQARIRAYERRSRIDGCGLSRRERARLDNMLDRSGRHIYRQKHDRQDRIP
ncbi:MAG TPA: hypothetical protein VFO63_17195 [Blastocatellia bacterium]|nr:hypothetical protein [Blastocatellia bacterium]